MGNGSHSSDRRLRITVANYFRAAYIFSFFSQLGFVYVGIKNRGISSAEDIILALLLAGVYVIPFAINFLVLRLWIKLFKPNIDGRQTENCYLGVWLFVTVLFSDIIFFLPYEPGSATQKQETIRILTPLISGVFSSPTITMLGVVIGLGGYRLSRQGWFFCKQPEIMTFVLFIVLSSVLFFVTWAFGNVGSILVLGLILSGVLGRMVKKYSERTKSTM